MGQSDLGRERDLLDRFQILANMGAENVSEGLSGMINSRVKMTIPTISIVALNELAMRMGGPEKEVVGIYLMTMDDLPGHVMLVLDYDNALHLADMLLEQPEGTCTELDVLARSALAEVGNLTASFFINAMATATGLNIRPSPPAVMVDMLGAILDIIMVAVGSSRDDTILLETHFEEQATRQHIEVQFWVIPDSDLLQDALNRSMNTA